VALPGLYSFRVAEGAAVWEPLKHSRREVTRWVKFTKRNKDILTSVTLYKSSLMHSYKGCWVLKLVRQIVEKEWMRPQQRVGNPWSSCDGLFGNLAHAVELVNLSTLLVWMRHFHSVWEFQRQMQFSMCAEEAPRLLAVRIWPTA
jgi:hypothetical protein